MSSIGRSRIPRAGNHPITTRRRATRTFRLMTAEANDITQAARRVTPAATLPFPEVGHVDLRLGAAARLTVPRYRADLHPWTGPRLQLQRTWHTRPIYAHRGRPLFAELAILGRLGDAGFDGVWIDAARGTMRVGLPGATAPVILSPERRDLLARIAERTPQRGGTWDLFAWHGNDIAFLRIRRWLSPDHITEPQLDWCTAALSCGVPETAFGVIDVVDATLSPA